MTLWSFDPVADHCFSLSEDIEEDMSVPPPPPPAPPLAIKNMHTKCEADKMEAGRCFLEFVGRYNLHLLYFPHHSNVWDVRLFRSVVSLLPPAALLCPYGLIFTCIAGSWCHYLLSMRPGIWAAVNLEQAWLCSPELMVQYAPCYSRIIGAKALAIKSVLSKLIGSVGSRLICELGMRKGAFRVSWVVR